jgi:hypothetical protein
MMINMIVITLALSSAMTGNLSRLGYMKVCNQANNKRHPQYGNYKAEFYTKTGKLKRTVFVEDYARKRDSVYELLAMIMEKYKEAEKQEKADRKRKKSEAKVSNSKDPSELLAPSHGPG